MASWPHDYSSALQERDKKEKTNQHLYHSYAKLADRTAALQAARSAEAASIEEEPKVSLDLEDRKASREKVISGGLLTGDTMSKVRQDLSEAQRIRGLLETRLHGVTEELQKLKIQCSLDSKRVVELSKEKATLITGMRDRDEELRGKAKLLEVRDNALYIYWQKCLIAQQDVHDETLSLTLQLNMAEEHSQRLRRENKELVDRWMARMAQEADAMNHEFKFS